MKTGNPVSRRRFLEASVGAGIGSLLAFPRIAAASATAEPAGSRLEGLFESDDPRLIRLAVDVMQDCVLAKIKPPEGTCQRRWLQAGTGETFYGQWIWDTMFVVDLLALLPEHQETLRDVFQNYWDFQERWNARSPEAQRRRLSCVLTLIKPTA